MQVDVLRLRGKLIGALPIIDQFIAAVNLHPLLTTALGHEAYADAICLLVKNILVKPQALYRLRQWADHFEPTLVYGGKNGDDTAGRALDRLFQADRAILLTQLVITTLKKFHIDTGQIHNDSTSVKFFGAYAQQKPKAVRLKRGFSKDHRPDLLQLVYSLSVTADGTVPVHFKAYDGNQSDDTTHWETWQTLRGILGRSDFVYVADSKLCVSQTLTNIDKAQGRFVTILPRTRAEVTEFGEQVFQSTVRWESIYRRRASRRRTRQDIFECAQGLYQMREGFRLYWYRSSEKRRRDEQERNHKFQSAQCQLKKLCAPGRRGPKTEVALGKAARKILTRYHVEDWLEISIHNEVVEKYKQTTRGKASKQTFFQRVLKTIPRLTWTTNKLALDRAKTLDGIFPLATNTSGSALEVLKTYKHQPKLEKRHSLFKSVLEISPVFLKNNDRIEALIFVYFISQSIAALIERTVREKMKERKIPSLPVLPENRHSKSPSAEQIIGVFEDRAKHYLMEKRKVVKTFTDPLSPLQVQILNMLKISRSEYL